MTTLYAALQRRYDIYKKKKKHSVKIWTFRLAMIHAHTNQTAADLHLMRPTCRGEKNKQTIKRHFPKLGRLTH